MREYMPIKSAISTAHESADRAAMTMIDTPRGNRSAVLPGWRTPVLRL